MKHVHVMMSATQGANRSCELQVASRNHFPEGPGAEEVSFPCVESGATL